MMSETREILCGIQYEKLKEKWYNEQGFTIDHFFIKVNCVCEKCGKHLPCKKNVTVENHKCGDKKIRTRKRQARKCRFCEKRFSRKWNKDVHEMDCARKRKGIKPIRCDHCGKDLITAAAHRRHVAHCDVKVKNICAAGYTKHARRKHQEEMTGFALENSESEESNPDYYSDKSTSEESSSSEEEEESFESSGSDEDEEIKERPRQNNKLFESSSDEDIQRPPRQNKTKEWFESSSDED